MTTDNKNYSIKLPEQFYCGFQRRSEDELLGFMTPFGTDKAFEKRKETVDSWATPRWDQKGKEKIEPNIIDNELLDGFRLDRHIKRYGWNGGNVVVRVEDPRGFELEISVANLCKILENNTVENGVIKNRCIWGRDGARNILLAENSEPYLAAIENTRRINLKPLSIKKDVNPGNIVLLKNGQKGTYLGKGYPVQMTNTSYRYYNDRNALKIEMSNNLKFFFTEDDGSLFSFSNPSVSEIVDASENWSEEESWAKLLEKTYVAFSKKVDLRLKLVPIEVDPDEESYFKDVEYWSSCIAVDNILHVKYLFDYYPKRHFQSSYRSQISLSEVTVNVKSITYAELVDHRKAYSFSSNLTPRGVKLDDWKDLINLHSQGRFQFFVVQPEIIYSHENQ